MSGEEITIQYCLNKLRHGYFSVCDGDLKCIFLVPLENDTKPKYKRKYNEADRIHIKKRASISRNFIKCVLRGLDICGYCGMELNINNFTMDHIKPKSKYFGLPNNKIPCCRDCNSTKADSENWEVKYYFYNKKLRRWDKR